MVKVASVVGAFTLLISMGQAKGIVLQLERRTSISTFPSECEPLRQMAEKKIHGWLNPFGKSLDTEVVTSTFSSSSRGQEVYYLVPVGTAVAFSMQKQPDGTFVSLFIDCSANRAYYSVRGGFVDDTRWYGPFQL